MTDGKVMPSCGIFETMGLWTLLEGCLLIANALAILNEDRFLVPRGWSFQEFSGVKRNSFKGQLIGLVYASQYLRVLLILLNTLCIVVKLVMEIVVTWMMLSNLVASQISN
ncbi:hypothetical protein M9H77_36384 [Catharanthus roseus]|uniref:Uncharacterized protein n=1 Tax=Catharanthus roseus TaxID=4058 RepID=A0ACB9ZSN3_CATRO|nr:hypothetical protein M9H77_36384 [Catharanthus roseus]